MDSTDLRTRLAEYFARRPDVSSAYLFGSRASGRTHSRSDVDVGVLLDAASYPTRSARSEEAVRINAAIIAVTHVNDVDIVVLNDVSPELGASIVTSGVRIHCGDESADHAAVRRILLRHADLRPFLDRTRKLKLDMLSGRGT